MSNSVGTNCSATIISVSPGELRGREDKGLPDENSLRDLARMYLECQTRLWPSLVENGTLPPVSEESVEQLASAFRLRFFSAEVEVFQSDQVAAIWEALGAAYVRYSCDNSNPRSLAQQLHNILERAARDKVFVPWSYVLADAAVTGTIVARRGYQMSKAVLRANVGRIQILFIDEIGRASRYAIEALRLGRLVDGRGKRMIGATDGFDSALPNSKFLLSMYAMLHEWFVDQLQRKVRRGMADAFARGDNVQPVSIGYKLVDRVDDDGNLVLTAKGGIDRQKVIDEQAAEYVVKAFRMFAIGRMSPLRIARRFNELMIGGTTAWSPSQIKLLLRRETYIGVEYYGMTYQVRDPETGEVTIKQRPREEWLRRENPKLRIISNELWQQAQERIRVCREAYEAKKAKQAGQPSRTSAYPKTLVRPACGYCDCDLYLGRSGEHPSYCCLNGRDRKHSCGLITYKSVALVEKAILRFVKDTLLTPNFIERVIGEANNFLAEYAHRPKESVQPILDEIKQTQAARDRLLKVLESEGEKDLGIVVEQMRRYERRLNELAKQKGDIEAHNSDPPPPLTKSDGERLLSDLIGVLNEDVALVNPVLAKLTGPIKVTQGQDTGRKRTPWVAHFRPNLPAAVLEFAKTHQSNSSGVWQFVDNQRGGCPDMVEVVIEEIPLFEQIAPKVKELHDQKTPTNKIAKMLKVTVVTARNALRFAQTGKRPKPKTRKPKEPGEKRRTRDEETHSPLPKLDALLNDSVPDSDPREQRRSA